MKLGPCRQRVVQIHPTRRCNLSCSHCYSTSSPHEAGELSPELLCRAISELHAEGYDAVSFSGGEPLLYTGLVECLGHARALGMLTAVTTNGLLLTPKRVEALAEVVDVLAISVDGKPESHDRIRGAAGCFERLRSRLELIREAKIPFGFIFTLTQYNLDELPWLTSFALEQGARSLQVHPLEEVGRASSDLPAHAPDEQECTVAVALLASLQEMVGDALRLHIDLCDRLTVLEDPARVYAGPELQEVEATSLADLLSPLIIEATGELVPLQYGFSRTYALGRVQTGSIAELARAWKRRAYPGFRRLAARVYEDIRAADHPRWFNWYAAIGEAGARRHLTSSTSARLSGARR